MTDPYKVLGVTSSSTDEEIKKAYRDLARKYHPDKYADSDLKDLANEKMQEINAAYDEIQNLRKQPGGTGNGASGYSYGPRTDSAGGSAEYSRVRVLINAGQIDEAERILMSVPAASHNAEWYFLFGCVQLKRGRYVDAQQYFNTACGMDPYNTEYRNARDQLINRTAQYGNSYSSDGCSACDVCQALICADCCCSMSRGCF